MANGAVHETLLIDGPGSIALTQDFEYHDA
jgi:hypothetical protein